MTTTERERRYGSDDIIQLDSMIFGSSLGAQFDVAEEFVEVTLDVQENKTVVLRSVEPATIINIEDGVSGTSGTPALTSASTSRSTSVKRSSSHRFRQFSQELKAEARAKAKHFSHELKSELRRFSWSRSQVSRELAASSSSLNTNRAVGVENGINSALAARDLRRQRAKLDRTRSGAEKALHGLRFISSKNNKTTGIDSCSELESNFNKLSKDGFLSRADFAQCIGSNSASNGFSTFREFLIDFIVSF